MLRDRFSGPGGAPVPGMSLVIKDGYEGTWWSTMSVEVRLEHSLKESNVPSCVRRCGEIHQFVFLSKATKPESVVERYQVRRLNTIQKWESFRFGLISVHNQQLVIL